MKASRPTQPLVAGTARGSPDLLPHEANQTASKQPCQAQRAPEGGAELFGASNGKYLWVLELWPAKAFQEEER